MKRGNATKCVASKKKVPSATTLRKPRARRDGQLNKFEKKMLDKNIEDILIEDDEDSKEEGSDSSEDFSAESMLRLMREMDYEASRRKGRNWSGIMFNIVICVLGFYIGSAITRFVGTGRWSPLADCQSDTVDDLCENCYGPFFGDWVWCLEGPLLKPGVSS